MLAILIFFDYLKEKRSVPPTKGSGIASFKNSCGTLVENYWFRAMVINLEIAGEAHLWPLQSYKHLYREMVLNATFPAMQ